MIRALLRLIGYSVVGIIAIIALFGFGHITIPVLFVAGVGYLVVKGVKG